MKDGELLKQKRPLEGVARKEFPAEKKKGRYKVPGWQEGSWSVPRVKKAGAAGVVRKTAR